MTTATDRTAYREAVAAIAQKAKEKLPECNGRVESAARLVINGDVEPQADGTVQAYTQIFRDVPAEQCTCPPITVYLHEGAYVVADGFHRVTAARRAGRTTLPAYIRTGTLEAAWLHAMETNISHGMPYTREDKQKIVTWFLDHPRYGTYSTRDIAKLTGNLIPHSTVANIRNRRELKAVQEVSKLDTLPPAPPPGPSGRPPAETPPAGPADEEEELPEGLGRMVRRFERTEEQHEAQYRRLRNIEGHMDLLMRANDPVAFGAWLRAYDGKVRGDRQPIHHLIERDLPRYIRWLQRLHDAYAQAPPHSLFEDAMPEDDQA